MAQQNSGVDPKAEQFKPFVTYTMNHEGAPEKMSVYRQRSKRLLYLADGDPRIDDEEKEAVDPIAWAILQGFAMLCEEIHWHGFNLAGGKRRASNTADEATEEQAASARGKLTGGRGKTPKSAARKRAESVRDAARKAASK